MNEERLQILKKNAVLINLARGGLIDEASFKKNAIGKENCWSSIRCI